MWLMAACGGWGVGLVFVWGGGGGEETRVSSLPSQAPMHVYVYRVRAHDLIILPLKLSLSNTNRTCVTSPRQGINVPLSLGPAILGKDRKGVVRLVAHTAPSPLQAPTPHPRRWHTNVALMSCLCTHRGAVLGV
jgi:hypothetical protein